MKAFDPVQIIRNIYRIPGTLANLYLIDGEGSLALIDTGLPGNHGKILGYIRSLGYASSAMKRISLTQSDMDHTGGLAGLRQVMEARVYAGAIEARAIAQGGSSRRIRPPIVCSGHGQIVF